jgi:hypothetical protein
VGEAKTAVHREFEPDGNLKISVSSAVPNIAQIFFRPRMLRKPFL